MNNNLLPYVLGALSTATLALGLFISFHELHEHHSSIVLYDLPDPGGTDHVSALH